jgi:predicted phage terminase large subunit-like protein
MKKKNNKIFEKILTDYNVRKNLVQKSFEYFFPIYFHQYMEYETAPFHEEMFRILQDERIKLSVFVAFRGSAKSTIISTAYVLWSILGIQQKKLIIICGQTEQKSRQYLMNIKSQLLNNDLLRKDLGPFEEERNSIGNATALIIKRLNVKIMISSVEQSIRGVRHDQHRPDLIIIDDIEDIQSVKTRASRDKTFDWLVGEVIPAGTKKTRIIAVGNLLHDDSVLKRLQKKIEGGEMKHIKTTYREYPIVDNKGNPLWPGKYPTQEDIEAEKEKTMNEVAWYREYMLQIISTDEQIIKPEWIKFYDKFPANNLRMICIGIDLAISEKEHADCTAIVVAYVYGVGKNLKIYIQSNPYNKRSSFPNHAEYIKALVATEKMKHHRVKVFVEDVGYQKALIQFFESKEYDIEGVSTGRNDKAARLKLTTPFVKDDRIFFPEKGCEELIDQLTGFGKERHDDLADAFSIVVLKIIENNPLNEGILFG